jgi:hypothetical protein
MSVGGDGGTMDGGGGTVVEWMGRKGEGRRELVNKPLEI